MDSVALRLPTLAWNQAGDWLMPSQGRQPQHTDVQVVAEGDVFSVYDSTLCLAPMSLKSALKEGTIEVEIKLSQCWKIGSDTRCPSLCKKPGVVDVISYCY